jgi:GntR family transcriptional regulator, transcriptional repressor for pyruvate dehydrogenase complex
MTLTPSPAPVGRREETYRLLRQRIHGGDYLPGARLPSEAALCAECGVSRPVVREALARLRVEGLVVSRHGAGTFVEAEPGRARGQPGFAPVRNLDDIRQCFEFRAALEGEAAAYAARQRSAAGAADIVHRAEVYAAEAHVSTGSAEAADLADFAFHEAVAEAAGISFFLSVIRSIRPHVLVGMGLAGELAGGDADERLRRVLAEHQAVVDAIGRGDTEAARAAMRAHIENSRRRLFGTAA